MLKATGVDGIYDCDPRLHPEARRYEEITYLEMLERRLKVMDSTAVTLCRDHALPLVVFSMAKPGNIARVLGGDHSVGTRVLER